MKNILIADDHSIVRLGASIALKENFPNIEIDQAIDYDETFKYLHVKQFDFLLLDINMPGGNNIKTIKDILAIQPDLKILIFSSYDESLYAIRYIESGASGYLNKNTTMDELIEAITAIENNGRFMSQHVQELYVQKLTLSKAKLTENKPLGKLSNREVDVAKHLIQGMGIIEVSSVLELSPSTVSTYKSRIFEKLQVGNIPELIELFRIQTEE